MKKIIFYIDTMYRGGAQRVIANLIEYFHQKGYDTILINDFIQDNGQAQYEIPKDIKRIYLRKTLGTNKVTKNIQRIVALRKIFKEENPDLVLSFLGRPNKRLLLASVGMKIKKVVSVRNDPKREYGNSKLKKIEARMLFRLADGCVFQTRDAAEYFPKSVQDKAAIIYNPVGLQFYSAERMSEPKGVVTVGRMELQKNQKMLINAFSKILENHPNETLTIYGEGPLRKELEEYCIKLGITEKVYMPGNIMKIEEKLSTAKIFVLPSDYEGMPNALMEAMTVGVPVISTDCPCGGPRTLIENNSQGLLFPCGDEKKLEELLRKLLDDSEQRKVMEKAEKERAQEFHPEIIYKKWENYLFP